MCRIENFYTNNIIQDVFSRVVGQKVSECVARLADKSPALPMAFLEIGAGPGSATRHILQEIIGVEKAAYCDMDILPIFTQYGQQKFGTEYPFMTFKTLNTEENLAAQGFDPGAWDMVILSNALQSTADIEGPLVMFTNC